jgi:hypothetical protein
MKAGSATKWSDRMRTEYRLNNPVAPALPALPAFMDNFRFDDALEYIIQKFYKKGGIIVFGKKGKKSDKAAPKAARATAKQPKQHKPYVPPNIYTLFLGLSALFILTAAVMLGLNYYWYTSTDPAVIPMSTWAR